MRQRPSSPRLESVSEADLVRQAQAGDELAFEQLVRAHADRLFAVLLNLLGNRSEAEDAAQETMLRAWRAIGSFQGRSQFFTWLYRIALNEANRTLEKKSRLLGRVALDDQGQIAGPASEEPSGRAEQKELREAIADALLALPPEYRIAIVLRDVEGLSTRDAANIVGIGQAAFKSRLHQARLEVRSSLGDEALLA
jgi:RNA polymerase sigma-70 factor (ECF subfamily)